MISVEDALARVLDLFEPLETETVPLAQAAGRVLGRDVHAIRSQPPFASSAMDGYALIAADITPGARLTVIGESTAGCRFGGTVHPGSAVRIFTGAPVPNGADRILIQEDCTRTGDHIEISQDIDNSNYIRPIGGDFLSGDTVTAPRLLGSADIALLAAMNIAQVPVRRRPVIALVPTGDELVVPGEKPGPDQIISSNNYGLKALFEAHGATARLLPIARDNEDSLRQILGLCDGVDAIVTLGGASVGDHDLVRKVAGDTGLTTSFYKVAMRPGKPLMAGTYNGIPMIGLPGNPVSSMVCGHIFMLPALRHMQGFDKAASPRKTARLGCDLAANGPRSHYMRARVYLQDDTRTCMPFERQDSSLLSVLARANALMVRPPGEAALTAGAKVDYISIGN
jgi:molybdopterin molybdotransferase